MHAPIPFVYLCDPTPDVSFDNLVRLVQDDATAIIAGVPFSDPCADGEVLETACGRAFRNSPGQATSFELVRRFKAAYPHIHLYVRAYANQVYVPGIYTFMKTIKELGAEGVLILDLPVSMVKLMPEWKQACDELGLALIQSLPMNASDETLQAAIELAPKVVLFEYQSHCPIERLHEAYERIHAAGIPRILIGSNEVDRDTLSQFDNIPFDGFVIETAVAALQNACTSHVLPEKPLQHLFGTPN